LRNGAALAPRKAVIKRLPLDSAVDLEFRRPGGTTASEIQIKTVCTPPSSFRRAHDCGLRYESRDACGYRNQGTRRGSCRFKGAAFWAYCEAYVTNCGIGGAAGTCSSIWSWSAACARPAL